MFYTRFDVQLKSHNYIEGLSEALYQFFTAGKRVKRYGCERCGETLVLEGRGD